MMPQAALLQLTDKGLYCPAGDFYVDPHRPVARAVVTHAHSDHARRGSQDYFCVRSSVGLMKLRLGNKIKVQGFEYGETFSLDRAKVSFHSAGHMLGSAQVRIEVDGKVWVASGDYKRAPDPTCLPFEVVPCDVFVTEATFGTPSFVWEKSASLGQEMFDWYQENHQQKTHSILLGYSIGKSQRILGELLPYLKNEEVWVHPTLEPGIQCYRNEGVAMCATRVLNDYAIRHEILEGSLIVAPPSVQGSEWAESLGAHQVAFASGWMSGQGHGHGRNYEKGFAMSDHADWPDLLRTIAECGAKHVYVQHRGKGALVRHLRSIGIDADPVEALIPKVEAPTAQMKLFDS